MYINDPSDFETSDDFDSWMTNRTHHYTQPNANRDGLFKNLPEDPVASVLQIVKPPTLTIEQFHLRCIVANIPFVILCEVCWFSQFTRTDYAYETNGCVNKQGVSISEALYKKYSWSEYYEWYDFLKQVSNRYNLSEDQFTELRVVSLHIFTRRRLGEHFKVLLCSSSERRAAWVDARYQAPILTHLPFIFKYNECTIQELGVGEKICKMCTKICKTTCAKCRKVPYCSKICQKNDHKRHKKLCGQVANIKELSKCIEEHAQKKFNVPSYHLACIHC